MAARNEYTDTVRDLHQLIRREADDQKRASLSANVDKMALQLERLRDERANLAVLTERVEGLTWLVRSVIVASLLEIIVGVGVALVVHSH